MAKIEPRTEEKAESRSYTLLSNQADLEMALVGDINTAHKQITSGNWSSGFYLARVESAQLNLSLNYDLMLMIGDEPKKHYNLDRTQIMQGVNEFRGTNPRNSVYVAPTKEEAK